MGGIITGIRNNIEEGMVNTEEEGIQERRLIIRKEEWRILTVYSKDMESTRKTLEKIVTETESRKVIIGGDWNARIGEEGTIIWREMEKEKPRRSKDRTKNDEGKKMIEMVAENGWSILNGNIQGDEEGEWTYVGSRGSSVIDYVIVNVEARDEIMYFKLEERIESDHMPLKIELEAVSEMKQKEEEEDAWKEKKNMDRRSNEGICGGNREAELRRRRCK